MAKKATGRSLEDFKSPDASPPLHLSRAEEELLLSCARGGHPPPAMRPTRKPPDDELIRASFLRFLILGGDEAAPIHEEGVRLEGAWIEGDLELDGSVVPCDLALQRCWFNGRISLVAGESKRIELDGSYVERLSAGGAKIKGDLFLRDNFCASQGVSLTGATIEGDLDCEGGLFWNNSQDCERRALACDRIVIKGDVFLNENFHAIGAVRFLNSKISGDVDCRNGRFESEYGPALVFDGSEISGRVKLTDGFTSYGEVRLANAKIDSHLDCRDGRFKAKSGALPFRHALVFDGAKIGAVAYLSNGFTADGVVRLHGATIFGDLFCEGGEYSGAPMEGFADHGDMTNFALSANRAHIAGRFFFRRLTNVSGNVSLAHTHVGVLVDDHKIIDQLSKDSRSNFYLDGFTYDRIDCAAPVAWDIRLKWLQAQPEDLLSKKGFRPQPWVQLIKVLRDMGHLEQARQIAIKKENHAHQIGKGVRYTRPVHWAFGKLVGYGHRPSWLVMWMISVWFACGIFYYWAARDGFIGPTSPAVFNAKELAQCRVQPTNGAAATQPTMSNWFECNDMPGEYPTFSPFIYSLDLILPVVVLDQAKNWGPIVPPKTYGSRNRWIVFSILDDARLLVVGLLASTISMFLALIDYLSTGVWRLSDWREPMAVFVRFVTWVEHLFGWAASLLMVATLSGMVKKDND